MDIRELYASEKGSFVIAGACEKNTQILDMRDYHKVMDLKTKFTGGGRRLAISEDGKYCAAAAYIRAGVTLYNAQTGAEIWNTKKIKHIQCVKFTRQGGLAVSDDSGWTYILSLRTGEIIRKKGGADVIFNPYDEDILIGDYSIAYENGYPIESKTGKLILSVCSLPKGVAYSAMRGGLYVYSTNEELVWEAENRENEHFVKLSYMPKYNYLCGIIYKYNEPRTEPFYEVYCYDAESGELKYKCDLDEGYAYTFIQNAEQIFSGSGRIFQLNKDHGEVVNKVEV